MGIYDDEQELDLSSDDEDQLQDNSEAESEESSEDDEDVKRAEPAKEYVYNRELILDKLGDISWPQDVQWIDKLTIDIEQQQEVDVNDDLARELAFYTQALEGTREAFVKFQKTGIPFLRPADFYAEMVKTDTHMEKVKGRLLSEKKKIEEAKERRKAREAKKLSKEVQAQKQKERTKQKKEEIESVKKWRKQRQKSGFSDKDVGELPPPFDFEDGKSFERSKKKRPSVGPGDRFGGGKMDKKMKRKRESRDSRFGFGGRKGMKKQNTADTTNDVRDFKKGSAPASNNKKRKR